ncbi:hypothetical protein [Gordonia sp. UCD-TK1]|uniref:hypothetical protein n=1 Tax=Gordonia sp. UCD-TK1 TaxID=1857893 RepID=UPI0011126B60|nr:hypothetical protein [Gordonia sp. UCD-TK1]
MDLQSVSFKNETGSTEDGELVFERVQYGSNTRPGELLRDNYGNYAGFETGREGTLVYWSTFFSLDDLIDKARSEGIGIDRSAMCTTFFDGGDPDGVELELSEVLDITGNREAVQSIAVPIGEIGNQELCWQAPYLRFEDRDSIRAEASFFSTDFDSSTAKSLIAISADDQLLAGAGFTVIFNSRGKFRKATLLPRDPNISVNIARAPV